MPYISERYGDDGSYQRWNMEQYSLYKRTKSNTNKYSPSIQHPILGKEFTCENGIAVFIQVVKHWYGGYYYYGIYEINHSGSHGTAVIENINSINETILESLEHFQLTFIPKG